MPPTRKKFDPPPPVMNGRIVAIETVIPALVNTVDMAPVGEKSDAILAGADDQADWERVEAKLTKLEAQANALVAMKAGLANAAQVAAKLAQLESKLALAEAKLARAEVKADVIADLHKLRAEIARREARRVLRHRQYIVSVGLSAVAVVLTMIVVMLKVSSILSAAG